jgi:hypothetical protein
MMKVVTKPLPARGRGRDHVPPSMDILTAKYLLCELWLLIDTARDRELCLDEAKEVQRLCQAIGEGVPGLPVYSSRAEGLPLFVFSSGVCDSRDQRAIRQVLEELNVLRNLLESKDE